VERVGSHKPAGPWRGGKYSLFEGGTRMPFIVHWPGRVQPGTSDALVSQVDFCASLGRLVGQKADPTASPDSMDVLPALLGDSRTGRDHLVEYGRRLALRVGNWKYITPGRVRDTLDASKRREVELPKGGLYDLAADPGETANLIGRHPEKAKELAARLEQISALGTRPVGKADTP